MKLGLMGVIVGTLVLIKAVVAENSTTADSNQVEVQALFISFTKPDIDASLIAFGGGIPNKDTILDLIKEGKGTVLFAPRTVATSGQEAVMKVVDEVVYPTRFDFHPTLTNAASLKESQLVVLVPSAFEMRETGFILQFVPLVTENGTIILRMSPQMVTGPIWKIFKGKCITADGKEHELAFEQPIFHTKSIATTTIQIANGETVIAGGGMWGQNEASVTFLLVSAQTVNDAGNAIHKTSALKKKEVFVQQKVDE